MFKTVHSLYNVEEMDEVISYVAKLLNGSWKNGSKRLNMKKMNRKITIDDIGIITPYRRQGRTLVTRCKERGWENLKIGSVETFQGLEKPIIIVSTVRSRMDSVGFLNNARVC